jgi:hypothetical protein
MTVSANAEFAQSYKHHARTWRRFDVSVFFMGDECSLSSAALLPQAIRIFYLIGNWDALP